MVRGGQAAREASVPPRPTLRGLRAGTGASDDRARAGTQAGAALPPLSPCRSAAAADGARRTRSGRAGSVERRPDRAAGEWPLGRRHAPPLVEVAPPCAEGRPRRARSRLSAVRPIRPVGGTHVVWRCSDGESGPVGTRRSTEGNEGTNDTVGDAVPPLWQAQGAVLPVQAETAGQSEAAPRSVLPMPARAARRHSGSHGLARFPPVRMLIACRRPRAFRS